MIKILIADDVDGWRNFHREKIEELFDSPIIDIACSAAEAYSRIVENIKNPYNIILTDMQMETDYAPKHAGEWLIEQVQTIDAYYKTKIVIISATYNIENIANIYNVDFIRKSAALNFDDAYSFLQTLD